jgi:hypothetical protein
MICISSRQRLAWATSCAACWILAVTNVAVATIYDFNADGQEYNGNILGQNPLFVPGGLRTLPELNDLYQTSNGLIVDEFEVGSGNPVDFRMSNGSYTSWENGSPTVASWVNSRDGYKFPAGSALGGEFAGSLAVGENVTIRAYQYPVGSGLHTEVNSLPVVDEMTLTVENAGTPLQFRFDSLSGDVRSFVAHRTDAEGKFLVSPIGMSTNSIEITTVADDTPPPFRHSPTQVDFANVGITYPIDAFVLDDSGQEGIEKVNAAFDSSHGFHDEEFVIGRPNEEGSGGFSVGGAPTNGYADRWLNMGGTEGYVNFWVNAKEGNVFPEDAAIGVTRFNPGWTQFDNGGQPVEVIIRAYAEPIETGTFEELEGLTVVGEARGLGNGTFNTPPVMELTGIARSFTVQTGDGNGNFTNFETDDGWAGISLNQLIVDTIPDPGGDLQGDYNGDGTVDAADYTVWRDTLNSSDDLRADGNDNGTVDGADYGIWKTHFGESANVGLSATSAAVPEPASGALLLLTMATLSTACRRLARSS